MRCKDCPYGWLDDNGIWVCGYRWNDDYAPCVADDYYEEPDYDEWD